MPKPTKNPNSNQQMIIDLIREISGQANLLTIPKIFITLTGDLKTALFLSQCIYWGDRSSTGDGWFWKSTDDWEEEIGLGYKEVVRCRKELSTRNLMWYEVHQIPNGTETRGFYKINIDCLYQIIQNMISEKNSRITQKAIPRITQKAIPTNYPKGNSPNYPKGNSLNGTYTEPTSSEPTTEPTSSSYPLQNNQEEEEEVEVTELEKLGNWAAPKEELKISERLILALEEVDVFESLYPEIIKSGWTEDQLLELVVRVKKSNCENPGAIFMWRLRNQKPPRAARTAPSNYAMPAEVSDELEIPDEVYDAWEKTLCEVSLKVSNADYSTWIEPLSITGYNGSLVLHAANPMVIDHLKLLGLNGRELGILFSNHLGQKVPVVFG